MNNDLEESLGKESSKQIPEKSWKQNLWGTENPWSILWLNSLIVLASMMLYGVMTQGFFPSDQYSGATQPILWIVCIGGSVAYYWAYAKGKIKFKEEQKKIKPFALLMVPSIFYFTVFFSTIGLGRAYTEILGKPAQRAVTVKIKEHPKANEECLESEELGTGTFIRLCIQREDYLKIKDGDTLFTSGKESWFGYVFQKYREPR